MNTPLRSAALVAVVLFLSCSSTPPSTCQSHLDCATGQMCQSGACVDPTVTPDCSAGQTRPCGPDAVGECRKGT